MSSVDKPTADIAANKPSCKHLQQDTRKKKKPPTIGCEACATKSINQARLCREQSFLRGCRSWRYMNDSWARRHMRRKWVQTNGSEGQARHLYGTQGLSQEDQKPSKSTHCNADDSTKGRQNCRTDNKHRNKQQIPAPKCGQADAQKDGTNRCHHHIQLQRHLFPAEVVKHEDWAAGNRRQCRGVLVGPT